MGKTKYYINQKEIDLFEMIYPMIDSMTKEVKALSAKKPSDVLNVFKIRMINRLITTARELLKNQNSLSYLDVLDEETLPQNSDVVLILTQYIEALNHFKEERQRWDSDLYINVWNLK